MYLYYNNNQYSMDKIFVFFFFNFLQQIKFFVNINNKYVIIIIR